MAGYNLQQFTVYHKCPFLVHGGSITFETKFEGLVCDAMHVIGHGQCTEPSALLEWGGGGGGGGGGLCRARNVLGGLRGKEFVSTILSVAHL